MRIGLSYDLKTAVTEQHACDDALEEYDSPETVAILRVALESKGHDVVLLGGGNQFLDAIQSEKVDMVFNMVTTAAGRPRCRLSWRCWIYHIPAPTHSV